MFLDLRKKFYAASIPVRTMFVAFGVCVVLMTMLIENVRQEVMSGPYAVEQGVREAAAKFGNEIQEKAVVQLALAYEIAARDNDKEEAIAAEHEVLRAVHCVFQVFDPNDEWLSPPMVASTTRISVLNTRDKHQGYARHVKLVAGEKIPPVEGEPCNWQDQPLYK